MVARPPKFVIKDSDQIVTVDGRRVAQKRAYILEYLRQKGAEGAYVMEMFRGWQQLCDRIGKNPGSYENFRASIYQAKEDGLIERFREAVSDHYFPMVFYRLKKF